MSEIHLKLSELRDCAEQLRQSKRQLDQSLTNIGDVLRELTVLGMEEHEFVALGRPQMHTITHWTQRLNHFADRLTATADDVENAVLFELPHFDLSLLPERDPIVSQTMGIPSSVVEVTTLDTGGLYVSSANTDLFLTLRERQNLLAEQIGERTILVEQHQTAVSELEATRNRALSYNPDLDLNSVPRIQALQNEVSQLESEITQMDTTITSLETEVQTLDTRLMTIQPSSGADMSIIADMEGSATNPHVVNNTYDCVNHVVQKLPIPHNMALDAHSWNDLALQHPEYGITIGDQPLEGSVIVLEREHSYADDVFGHVLYVESVSDGEVWVTDNNNPEPIRFSDLTDQTTGDLVSYLYFPWHTRG